MTRKIFIAALTVLTLWAWCAQPASAGKEKKTLQIVYVEWDCATASSNLAKAVLEDKLGYKVELLPVTQPILWTSLASGDADAMVTAWLPETHAVMYAKVKNKVDMLGKLVGGARLGWAVPDYVPLKSIDELDANAAKFKGSIVGIDPGSGLMQLSEKAMRRQKRNAAAERQRPFAGSENGLAAQNAQNAFAPEVFRKAVFCQALAHIGHGFAFGFAVREKINIALGQRFHFFAGFGVRAVPNVFGLVGQ